MLGAILVAGMMRHIFELSAIDTFGKGLLSGLGIGLFLVSPWVVTFYSFGARPRRLMLIDCGYASFGCALIGAVLGLFRQKKGSEHTPEPFFTPRAPISTARI